MSGRGARPASDAAIEGVRPDEADVLEPERAGDGLSLVEILRFEVAQLGGEAGSDSHRFSVSSR